MRARRGVLGRERQLIVLEHRRRLHADAAEHHGQRRHEVRRAGVGGVKLVDDARLARRGGICDGRERHDAGDIGRFRLTSMLDASRIGTGRDAVDAARADCLRPPLPDAVEDRRLGACRTDRVRKRIHLRRQLRVCEAFHVLRLVEALECNDARLIRQPHMRIAVRVRDEFAQKPRHHWLQFRIAAELFL